jgi:hypothetical protein
MNYASTIRSLLLEESKPLANERVAELRDVQGVGNDCRFESDGYIFSEAKAAELRGFAFNILWAFEYNKLLVKYRNRLALIEMKRIKAPKCFKRYRFALRTSAPSNRDAELLALILAYDADDHYGVCGTFPRTTENAFTRKLRERPPLGQKLTDYDLFALENEEQSPEYSDVYNAEVRNRFAQSPLQKKYR